ncbi:MAG: peptide chain release factor 1, partial [Planctomycetes bacterium]|nr:peptide chain release factor 1 [Planctomycetota bacterium]
MTNFFEKVKSLAERYHDLEARSSDPQLIKDQVAYQKVLKEMGGLGKISEAFHQYEALITKMRELEELLKEGGDEELTLLVEEELTDLKTEEEKNVKALKRLLVSDDTHVGKSLIVEIRAGTGGDEASLFAADLHHIYQHFAENNHLKVEVLDLSQSEVGGFKEIVFSVSGKKAWELFRFESGGHRVQRVPVTESQGRIHTSAATVAVLPEAEEVEIDVKEADLRIDTYRAGGPGGQNVNKVSSAIRITHLPTGLVVQCQDESSQHKNKAKAMRILKARLYDQALSQAESERADARRGQIGTGDRNMRIRTYNYPQNRVTDHRIKINYSLEIVEQGGLE